MSSEVVTSLAAADRLAIQSLAEESQAPLEVVEVLYLEELRQLEVAQVKQFVPVIVGRRVRDRLRTTREA